MSILQNLVAASQLDESALRQQARSRRAQWQSSLAPVSDAQPTGDDPGYDDDFQRIREEVNKISGVDTELICQLAEKLLTQTCKDLRVITFTCGRVCSGMVKPVWRRALRCWRQCLSGLGLCSIPSVNVAVNQRWNSLAVAGCRTVCLFIRKST